MFKGFNEKTIEFLWGVRFNNEKGWFEENKQSYIENLYLPMKELAAEAAEKFSEETGIYFVGKSSRIYRDARRVRLKGPYKESMWFVLFEPCEHWADIPAFYFELRPEYYEFGMGSYNCPPSFMKAFREKLTENPARSEKLIKETEKYGYTAYGEEYKRPRLSGNSVIDKWLVKKKIGFCRETENDELLTRGALVGFLVERFKELVPAYNFIKEVLEEGDGKTQIR